MTMMLLWPCHRAFDSYNDRPYPCSEGNLNQIGMLWDCYLDQSKQDDESGVEVRALSWKREM